MNGSGYEHERAREGENVLLSHVALGGGVERHQLYSVGVLWSQLKQHLLKGMELTTLRIHIILVHLRDRRGEKGMLLVYVKGKHS